jgi:hypothetical protein
MRHHRLFVIAAGLSAFAAAQPTVADTAAGDHLLGRQVQACVEEIGKQANYAHANKALHEVVRLEQKNLEEISIEIETSVFHDDSDAAARRYSVSCVVGTLNEVVKFKMREETTRALATAPNDSETGRS